MKILCVDAVKPLCDKGVFTHKTLKTFADSTLMRDARQPLFLPDWAAEWSMWILPAIKVCRQGLNIQAAFAGRYFDSIALAAMLLPKGLCPLDAPAPSLISDSTLRIGEWLPWKAGDDDTFGDVQIVSRIETLGSNNTLGRSSCISARNLDVEGTLCSLSIFSTLKTGDIILPYHPDLAQCFEYIKENQYITANLNNFESLRLKIK